MVAVPMFAPLGSCRIFMVLPLILTTLGYVEVHHTTFFPPKFSPNVPLCLLPCFGLLGCVWACWGAWGGLGPNCWFLARSLNAMGKSPRVGQIGVNRFFRLTTSLGTSKPMQSNCLTLLKQRHASSKLISFGHVACATEDVLVWTRRGSMWECDCL